MLREPRMPNKPDTKQNKEEGENESPRTDWNSKRALLKSKSSVRFNKLVSFYLLRGRKRKQTPKVSIPDPYNFPEG